MLHPQGDPAVANFRAIATLCEAVTNLLKSSYLPQNFGGSNLETQVGLSPDRQPPALLISLCVYRIYPNGNTRHPPGRINPDGSRQRARLPLDVHFLLTVWGTSSSTQLSVAGWMMRVLEDHSTLSASLLNTSEREVFQQDEIVELTFADLSNDDLFRIWEKLTDQPFQLSIPYVARNVWIDSLQDLPAADPVRERVF